MGSYRQQTLIEAPVETVWAQVGDPNTYPEWTGEVVEVKGLEQVELGARYEHTGKAPLRGAHTTEFVVDAFEEMREISVRCTVSGWYMDPTHVGYRAVDSIVGKRWYRQTAEHTLEQLRSTLA